jgi:hypothetical protein
MKNSPLRKVAPGRIRVLWALNSPKYRNGFDVGRVGKQIECLDVLQSIPRLQEVLYVTRQRGHIT